MLVADNFLFCSCTRPRGSLMAESSIAVTFSKRWPAATPEDRGKPLTEAPHEAAREPSNYQRRSLMFTLSKLEIRQLLSAINLRSPFGQRDYLLVMFLYQTGLRVGECSGLITTHVATRDGVARQRLHLPAMICKGSRGRVIALNQTARACVEKLLAFNRARGFSTAPAAPLLQHRKHGPLSVRSIQKLIKGYREAADLDVQATPHSFRHAHASELLAAGATVPAVQNRLGHASLASTQVYCHVSDSQLDDTAALIG